MQRVLQDCSRIGHEAINLEDISQDYEAYKKYIDCCLQAFKYLSVEANALIQENNAQRLELAKLASMCTERIVTFCQVQITKSSAMVHQPIHRVVSAGQSVRPSPPPVAPRSEPPHSTPTHQAPPHSVNVTSDEDDPMQQAKRMNQMLVEQLKKRLERMKCTPQRKANLTHDLFRKISENNERAKEMQEQQKRRQIQLKADADRRTSALKLKDPAKKKEHNELLTRILVHDDKFKWLLSLKSQLSNGSDLNTAVANEFCQTILRSSTHPMAQITRDCQTKVKQVVEPLYNKYNRLVSDHVSVPYQYFSPVLSDEAVAQLEASEDMEDQESEEIDNTFEINCDSSVDELKLAKYKTDKEIGKLIHDDKQSPAEVPTKDPNSTAAHYDDDMDYLFDSDEDEVNNDLQKLQLPDNGVDTHTSDSDKLDNQQNGTSRIKEELDQVEAEAATLEEQLAMVTKFIHETMHCLSILFRLAYDPFNCEEGYDIVNTVIQERLFAEIGEPLQLLYRLANIKKERIMAQVMTDFQERDLSDMQVKEKWHLDTNGECYNHLVSHLQRITTIHSPLEKAFSYAVRINTGVVETTSAFFAAKQMQEPMGADDLLPIICYIIVKSELPQIISQCSIMTDFIPSEYMLEQEGYCLSTVQMAVEYLLTLV